MKVALYARVSTERQHERGTISSQLEALRAAADADGHNVIEEFIDDGYSGARLDRPALDRLRDAAQAGVLDGVICLAADRLAPFAQVRQALLDPRQLFAGERAVITGAPADANELVAAQLKRLDSALGSNERERARLIDAYQAGLLELDDLTSRTAAITARRDQLAQEKTALTLRSAELATENQLRRRLAGFAEQVAATLDDLDTEGRRRLLRLVIEKVRVTGWRVEIHLKIPLPEDPPTPGPAPDNGPSSDMRLRSLRGDQRRQLPHARPPRRHPRAPTRHHRWGKTVITPGEFS